MFMMTLCHLVVSFGKCFSKKSQHHLPHCSAKKWLALTPKHGDEDFSQCKALSFVNSAKLVNAIARPFQGAIPLAERECDLRTFGFSQNSLFSIAQRQGF